MKYQVVLMSHRNDDTIVIEESRTSTINKMKEHKRKGSILKFPHSKKMYIVAEINQIES